MKFLAFFVVILAFASICLAAKNEVCNEPDSYEGGDGLACMAYFPLWTYKLKENKCVRFIYGGCNGNNNLFSTEAECIETCQE